MLSLDVVIPTRYKTHMTCQPKLADSIFFKDKQ